MPSFSISTSEGNMNNDIIINGESYRTRITDAGISLYNKLSGATTFDLGNGLSFNFGGSSYSYPQAYIRSSGIRYSTGENYYFDVSHIHIVQNSYNYNFEISNDGIRYSNSSANNFSFYVSSGSLSYNNSSGASLSLYSGGLHYNFGNNHYVTLQNNGIIFDFDTYNLSLYIDTSTNKAEIKTSSTSVPTYIQNIRFGLDEASSRSDLSANFKTYIATKDDLLIVLDELYTAVQDLESRVSALEGN